MVKELLGHLNQVSDLICGVIRSMEMNPFASYLLFMAFAVITVTCVVLRFVK